MTLPLYPRISRRLTSLLTVAVLTPTIGVFTAGTSHAGPCTTYYQGLRAERSRLIALGELSPGGSSLSSDARDFGPADAASDDPKDFRNRKQPPWLRGMPGQLPIIEGHTEAIHLLTGPGSPERTHHAFGVGGTDLGIAFDDGKANTYFAFGDTMGCGSDLQWRSNVLLRSSDRDYSDKLTGLEALTARGWAREGFAREFIPSRKEPGIEHTTIPTAGIAVGGALYIDYMSVRSWGQPGMWTTNYAATMVSHDEGRTWQRVPESIRPNPQLASPYGVQQHPQRSGDEKTQMSALVAANGYVYRFSTPAGRHGDAILARAAAADFPREDAFEFFTGEGWVRGVPDQAASLFDAPVSEMSVVYNEFLGRFTAMYYSNGGLVLRTASSPEGPWSPPRVVVDTGTIPDLYGGFLLPETSGSDMYFVATTWSNYNVMVMRTDLTQLFAGGASGGRAATGAGTQPHQQAYDPSTDDGLRVVDWIVYDD